MKKTILSVAIATIFGMQSANLMAYSIKDIIREADEKQRIEKAFKEFEERKKREREQALAAAEKKRLEIPKKIYESIAGSRQFDIPQAENVDTLYFQLPRSIYNKSNFNEKSFSESVLKWVAQIQQEEKKYIDDIKNFHSYISARSELLGVIDKAISWQVFENIKNRFSEIEKLEEKINTALSLKEIADLQAHIKAMLAKIQNETTKLQMVAHLSNAERILKEHQKQQYNIKIFKRTNKEMPQIRHGKST